MKTSRVWVFVPAVVWSVTVPFSSAQGVDTPLGAHAAVDDARRDAKVADHDVPGGFVEPKPGDRPQLGGWYLGVYGNYTSTGLVLTQVYPRTAAAKAGLEVGDRIVAVNGRQIGMVLNTRLTLDVALQKTRNGWVRLLVQDRRTNQLINMDVQLTRGRVHT